MIQSGSIKEDFLEEVAFDLQGEETPEKSNREGYLLFSVFCCVPGSPALAEDDMQSALEIRVMERHPILAHIRTPVAGGWGSFNKAFKPWPRACSVMWWWLCMICHDLRADGIKEVHGSLVTMAQAFLVNLHSQREPREQTPPSLQQVIDTEKWCVQGRKHWLCWYLLFWQLASDTSIKPTSISYSCYVELGGCCREFD